jgi:PAS domain S-box-containing protein
VHVAPGAIGAFGPRQDRTSHHPAASVDGDPRDRTASFGTGGADQLSMGVPSPVTPQQLLAVLDGLPGMVGYWDRDLRNIVANKAYLEYFGFSPEQMRGIHISEVLGESVYQANLPYLRRALQGEEQPFDRTLVDVRGRTRHTQASYVPDIDDGEVRGVLRARHRRHRTRADEALYRAKQQGRNRTVHALDLPRDRRETETKPVPTAAPAPAPASP